MENEVALRIYSNNFESIVRTNMEFLCFYIELLIPRC